MVDDFEIDPVLHETLLGVRESVRRLFEQLRLKHEDSDISGKDRLERVPALAKRNFANLTGPNTHLATRQAWRLIDFLEGNGREARLSLRAREGLRTIELDRQVAALRSSKAWQMAALDLRCSLGVAHDTSPVPTAPVDGTDAIEPGVGHSMRAGSVGRSAPPRPGRWGRERIAWLLGATTLGVCAVIAARWWLGDSSDPRYACLALEDATEGELALHWFYDRGTTVPRPVANPAARPHLYRIDDPAGGQVRSTWTTSVYSYAEHTVRLGPGGGRSDVRLRVGGWGDTYLSLLKVPVPTNRLVQRAVLQLTVLGDAGNSRPTTMSLRAIGDDWQVGAGSNDRLWWRDCPQSTMVRSGLPTPGLRGTIYEIDITDLYNLWVLGQQAPYGVMLEPEHVGSWGVGREHFSNFNTFYSTRARDPADRPRLILLY